MAGVGVGGVEMDMDSMEWRALQLFPTLYLVYLVVECSMERAREPNKAFPCPYRLSFFFLWSTSHPSPFCIKVTLSPPFFFFLSFVLYYSFTDSLFLHTNIVFLR